MDTLIDIDDFPQLALLAWNRVERKISRQEALALYERNWRFVAPALLDPAEANLIKELSDQYGHGILNV